MIIIGCDYHPGFQQVALVETDTGECKELRLQHPEAAEKFYRDLAVQGVVVRVGYGVLFSCACICQDAPKAKIRATIREATTANFFAFMSFLLVHAITRVCLVWMSTSASLAKPVLER
jgi:hypothetical protein